MSDDRTSIILLADGDLDDVKACVGAVHAHTAEGSYELVVVAPDPDGSTSRWLCAQSGLSLVTHESPLSASAALNLGILSSKFDNVLLLDSRVTVTAGYLPLLLNALGSGARVGAVGPATNSIHGQAVPVSYRTPDELSELAASFNSPDPHRWDRRLRLSCACLLLKREALEAAGVFDEQYSLSTLLDADLSFRLVAAGWTLLFAGDVFVHAAGRPHDALRSEEFRRQCDHFVAAWGFDPTYSSIQRSEVVALLDSHPPETALRVLELGCACGATLLEIKNRYPNAELYGIEMNEGAVAIGKRFADIRPANAEQPLDYPELFFDYVITADVLEHLVDPWRVVANIRPHLKATGTVIASIPNIMHVSVMRDLLNGRFRYQDAGILDRTHLRFFTLSEIDGLFAGAGYGPRTYTATTVPMTDQDLALVDALKGLSTTDTSDQFRVYQYLIKVTR
jgi:2-polyprenyl-3-methyl-5-hydroxy-6-metoxy-1,4-benzoquinol methylase